MIDIVVDGEQHISCGQLIQDAPHRPDITALVPLVALQQHLRASVLSRVYYRTMRLFLMGRPSEIDELDGWGLRESQCFVDCFVGICAEEDVFGFEVGVGVAVLMHEAHSPQNLSGEGLDVVRRVADEFVVFNDFVEWESEGFEDEAEMLVVVETFDVSDQVVLVMGITLAQLVYDFTFSFGRVDVFLHGFNHLTCRKVTFIAYVSSPRRPYNTLPNVPVPSTLITLYLWPNFWPFLNWKWGVLRRCRVEYDTELL